MPTQKHKLSATLFVLAGLVACGGEQAPDDQGPGKYTMPQPILEVVSPSALSAGDPMDLWGKGFVDDKHGVARLTFNGVYQNTSGHVDRVNLNVNAKAVNQGRLRWYFGPNIPFSTQQDTGLFRGTVTVTNLGLDGTIKRSKPIPTQLTVRPSIIIKQMRPISAGCSAGITDTLEDKKFLLEVKAVGLKKGSNLGALRYFYTFMKQDFAFEGYFGDKFGTDPEGLFPKKGPVTVIDDVTDGTLSRLGGGVPSNKYIAKGSPVSSGAAGLTTGLDKKFKLSHFKTAALAEKGADSKSTSILINAVDSSGNRAKRTVRLTVWRPIEVAYDGNSEVVRSFDPVPVSGCIHGGYIGRDVQYSEQTTETRQRSFTYSSGVSGGVDIKIFRLNAEFGIEVNATVTSAKAKNLQITATVLPKEYGVFYRQTLQMERVAKLKSHGACGTKRNLGKVVVTDWVWSPDLAKGRKCPPLPKSNLPKGKIFKTPSVK